MKYYVVSNVELDVNNLNANSLKSALDTKGSLLGFKNLNDAKNYALDDKDPKDSMQYPIYEIDVTGKKGISYNTKKPMINGSKYKGKLAAITLSKVNNYFLISATIQNQTFDYTEVVNEISNDNATVNDDQNEVFLKIQAQRATEEAQLAEEAQILLEAEQARLEAEAQARLDAEVEALDAETKYYVEQEQARQNTEEAARDLDINLELNMDVAAPEEIIEVIEEERSPTEESEEGKNDLLNVQYADQLSDHDELPEFYPIDDNENLNTIPEEERLETEVNKLKEEEQARQAENPSKLLNDLAQLRKEREERTRLEAEAKRKEEAPAPQAVENKNNDKEEQENAKMEAEAKRKENQNIAKMLNELAKKREEREEQARKEEEQVRQAAEKERKTQEEQARIAEAKRKEEEQVRQAAEKERKTQEEQARIAEAKRKEEQARLEAETKRKEEEKAREAATQERDARMNVGANAAKRIVEANLKAKKRLAVKLLVSAATSVGATLAVIYGGGVPTLSSLLLSVGIVAPSTVLIPALMVGVPVGVLTISIPSIISAAKRFLLVPRDRHSRDSWFGSSRLSIWRDFVSATDTGYAFVKELEAKESKTYTAKFDEKGYLVENKQARGVELLAYRQFQEEALKKVAYLKDKPRADAKKDFLDQAEKQCSISAKN
ncbi:MAG: hypothetical protein JSS07_00125 [Proteobacteria bacterium]|nr:hypothetical protein [Pseudomonadota bacterium]